MVRNNNVTRIKRLAYYRLPMKFLLKIGAVRGRAYNGGGGDGISHLRNWTNDALSYVRIRLHLPTCNRATAGERNKNEFCKCIVPITYLRKHRTGTTQCDLIYVRIRVILEISRLLSSLEAAGFTDERNTHR